MKNGRYIVSEDVITKEFEEYYTKYFPTQIQSSGNYPGEELHYYSMETLKELVRSLNLEGLSKRDSLKKIIDAIRVKYEKRYSNQRDIEHGFASVIGDAWTVATVGYHPDAFTERDFEIKKELLRALTPIEAQAEKVKQSVASDMDDKKESLDRFLRDIVDNTETELGVSIASRRRFK